MNWPEAFYATAKLALLACVAFVALAALVAPKRRERSTAEVRDVAERGQLAADRLHEAESHLRAVLASHASRLGEASEIDEAARRFLDDLRAEPIIKFPELRR